MKFEELIDIKELEKIISMFYKISNIPVGISDTNGKTIFTHGLQDICWGFHRKNEITKKRCLESNLKIINQLRENKEKFVDAKCDNGLWDIAFPIYFKDEFIAVFYFGQYLYEDEIINLDYFIKQAEQFNYNKTEYLHAITRLPKVHKQNIIKLLEFFSDYINLVINKNFSQIQKRFQLEKSYQFLLEFSNDAVCFIKDEVIISCNKKAEELFRLQQNEIIGNFFYDIAKIEKHNGINRKNEIIEKINEAVKGIPQNFEYVHKKNDGSLLYTDVTLALVEGQSENIVQAIIRNINEKKEAERVLKENEEKYRLFFEQSDDAYLIIKDNKFIDCNKAALNLLGCENKNEVINLHPADISPEYQPDGQLSKEKAEFLLNRTLETLNTRFEWIHLKKDGTQFYTEILLTALEYNNSKVIHSTWRDITVRKMEEMTMRFSQFLIENANDAIYIINEDGSYNFVNNAACNMLGYTQEELMQKYVWDVNINQNTGVFHNYFSKVKQVGYFSWESYHRKKDGTVIPVDMRANILTFENKDYVISFVRDMTEQNKKEKAIRDSEEKLKKAQSVAKLGNWEIDSNGEIIWFSQEALNIMGLDPNIFEYKIKELKTLIYDNNLEIVRSIRDFIDLPSDKYDNEFSVKRPSDGKIVYVHARAELIKHSDLSYKIIGTIQDITERKLAELKLTESQKIQTAIYKIAQSVNSTKNLDELYESIHSIISELMHAANFYISFYDPVQELISFPYFVDEYDTAGPTKKLGKGLTEYVLKTGKPLLVDTKEVYEMAKKGDITIIGTPSVDWLGVPLLVNNNAIGVLVVQSYTQGIRYTHEHKQILTFVSDQIALAIERKRTEISLIESEARNRAMLNAIPDLIFHFDNFGNFLDFKGARDILLMPPDMFLKKSIYEFMPEDIADTTFNYIQVTLKTGVTQFFEYKLDIQDEEKHFESRMAKINDREVITIIRDITERVKIESEIRTLNKQLNKKVSERTEELQSALEEARVINEELMRTKNELENAKEELETALEKEKELSELKMRFISMVSHEYRNPLTVILTSSYLIEQVTRSNQVPELSKFINNIRNSVYSMTHLLEDVLTLGKNESGKDTYKPVELELVNLCNVIKDEVDFSDKFNHKLLIKTELKICIVCTDEKHLRHILINLLTNATKYSMKDTDIILEIIDAGINVKLNVEDHGYGIAPEDVIHLFEPFHRGSTTSHISGSGLGLAIVKNSIDIINATITVESELGKGSIFTVTLPKRWNPNT